MTEKGMRLNKGLIEPRENDRTDGERLQVSVKGILTFVAPLDDISVGVPLSVKYSYNAGKVQNRPIRAASTYQLTQNDKKAEG